MFPVVVVLAQLAAPTPLDTALFPAKEAMIRLYTDCDEPAWPGLEELDVPKTLEELTQGVARLRALEARWRVYFAERAGDSIAPTDAEAWAWPLDVPGRLLDNFENPREGGVHGALDIFVPREGAMIYAPVSGVVVAAAGGWRGGWTRRRGGLWYEGAGMSRRQGNGLILFDPATSGYFMFSHLQDPVDVRTGDVVRRGQVLGRVGHTGNASQPGHGRHLHLAFKRAATACGVEGVLVAEDVYPHLRAARQRREAR